MSNVWTDAMASASPDVAQLRRPRVAVTLGDPAGIGPELIAKLLSRPGNTDAADIYLLADKSEVTAAEAAAGSGVHIPLASLHLLDDNSSPGPIPQGVSSRAAGARSLHQLRRALVMHQAGEVDAILFGPLNKASLKADGMVEEDELRWFANFLGYTGATSEINVFGPLWTARVTSHVGLAEVAGMVKKDSVLEAVRLLHKLRWESGIERPRLAVCALNPHNGEEGNFGRHEIDHIAPAVQIAREQYDIVVEGPYPADTIFLRRERYDGIVTMYHDQGQIALKILGFEGGVTVQGGLPAVIATPAHGTAFDIVGKGVASVASTQNAFDVAVTMAKRRLLKEGGGHERAAGPSQDAHIAAGSAHLVEKGAGSADSAHEQIPAFG